MKHIHLWAAELADGCKHMVCILSLSAEGLKVFTCGVCLARVPGNESSPPDSMIHIPPEVWDKLS